MNRVILLFVCVLLAGCASNPVNEHYRGPDRGFLVFSLQGNGNYVLNYKLKGSTSGRDFGEDGLLNYTPHALIMGGPSADFQENGNEVVVGVHSLKPGDYEIYTFSTLGFNGVGTVEGFPTGQFSLPFVIKPGETTYIGNFDGKPVAFGITFVVTDRHERDMATARRKDTSLAEAVTMAVPDVARLGNPYFRPK